MFLSFFSEKYDEELVTKKTKKYELKLFTI